MNGCQQTDVVPPVDVPPQPPSAPPATSKSKRNRKRRCRMTKGQANTAKDGLLCALLEDRKTLDDLTHEHDEEQLTTKTKAFVLSLSPNDGVWTGLEFGSDMHTERLTRAAVRVIKSMRAAKRRSTRGTATTDSVELAAATVSATFLDKSRSPTKPIIHKRLSEMLSTTPTTFVKRSTIFNAGAGLFARKRIKKGQVVAKFTGVLCNEPPDPDGRCIQLSSQAFLQCDNSAATFANTARNLNGTSSPPQQRRNNARIAASPSSASLVAVATIEPGAEILAPYGRHF